MLFSHYHWLNYRYFHSIRTYLWIVQHDTFVLAEAMTCICRTIKTKIYLLWTFAKLKRRLNIYFTCESNYHSLPQYLLTCVYLTGFYGERSSGSLEYDVLYNFILCHCQGLPFYLVLPTPVMFYEIFRYLCIYIITNHVVLSCFPSQHEVKLTPHPILKIVDQWSTTIPPPHRKVSDDPCDLYLGHINLKWFVKPCPLMSCICATYEYNTWNTQRHSLINLKTYVNVKGHCTWHTLSC